MCLLDQTWVPVSECLVLHLESGLPQLSVCSCIVMILATCARKWAVHSEIFGRSGVVVHWPSVQLCFSKELPPKYVIASHQCPRFTSVCCLWFEDHIGYSSRNYIGLWSLSTTWVVILLEGNYSNNVFFQLDVKLLVCHALVQDGSTARKSARTYKTWCCFDFCSADSHPRVIYAYRIGKIIGTINILAELGNQGI